jgi:hypothetical protein
MIVRSLYCANKATINITNNPIQHIRTKHIEINKHLIKEKLCADLYDTLCEDRGATCKYFNEESV